MVESLPWHLATAGPGSKFGARIPQACGWRAETKVVGLRDSKSRPNQGIVTFEHRGFNQHNEEVAYCRRTGLMMRRPA